MKTQESILVKNESLFSRLFSLLWFVNIFKKMSVQVTIGNDQVNAKTLQASNEPYLIDVTPGSHEFLFTDCRAAGKAAFNKSLGCMFSLILNLCGGASRAILRANLRTHPRSSTVVHSLGFALIYPQPCSTIHPPVATNHFERSVTGGAAHGARAFCFSQNKI